MTNSYDHRISTMDVPIPTTWNFHVESDPWSAIMWFSHWTIIGCCDVQVMTLKKCWGTPAVGRKFIDCMKTQLGSQKNLYKSCTKWQPLMPCHVWSNSFLVECYWKKNAVHNCVNSCHIGPRIGKLPEISACQLYCIYQQIVTSMVCPIFVYTGPTLGYQLSLCTSMWHCWAINRNNIGCKGGHDFSQSFFGF